MANYNLVVNSKFQPFSFERYIQPYQLYNEAYKEQQDALSELSLKANIWDKLANEQTDKEAYEMYKNYSDDLKNQIDTIAREGISPISRQAMLNLKSRYSKEITPIEQAYTARAQEAKEQLEGASRGMIYEGDAASSSLDRYLSNPAIRYNMANSQEGYKRVLGAASALAKELKGYGASGSLDKETGLWLKRHGYNSNEINKAISDINNAIASGNIQGNSILSDILANEMQTSGVGSWKNRAAQEDYFNRIAPALYGAVGETDISTYKKYIMPTPEDPEDPEDEGSAFSEKDRSVYFDSVELWTRTNDYEIPNIEGLKYNNKGELVTKEIEDLDAKIKEIESKPQKSLYEASPATVGYGLSHRGYVMNGAGRNQRSLSERLWGETNPQAAPAAALKNKRADLVSKLNDYKKKYEYLANDPALAMVLGVALDKQRYLESIVGKKVAFGDNGTTPTYLITQGIQAAKDGTTTGIYKIENNGEVNQKAISKDDLPDISDIKNFSMYSTPRGLIYSDDSGDKYLIKSTKLFNNYSKEITAINKSLTDYTEDKVSKGKEFNTNILVNNKLQVDPNDLIRVIANNNIGEIDSFGNIETTIKQPNGDVVNLYIYSTPDGAKLAYSSMFDIINGGKLLEESTDTYSNSKIVEIRETLINEEPSATLPSGGNYIIQ